MKDRNENWNAMPYSKKNLQPDTILEGLNSNFILLLPYFAPYIVYVGIAALFRGLSPEWSYSLKIVTVTAVLIWAWHRYIPFTGPKSTFISVTWGVLCGLVGTVIWIFLLRPFVDMETNAWSKSAYFLRLMAASILVPIFEELLMRGYIFRLAYQWGEQRKKDKGKAFDRALNDQSINNFKPGAWSTSALLVSTIAFTLGHQIQEWPAAFLYGILMVFLWITRKDLISCIVAHGTTNFALGLYVYFTNQWELW